MSHSVTSSAHYEEKSHKKHDVFLVRFRKNLLIEFLTVLRIFSFSIKLIIVSFIALLGFFSPYIKGLLGELIHAIPQIGTGLNFIIPKGIIFVIGMYLTLLPLYVVILLLCIPKKAAFPVVGLASFLSLFIIFLV